jgi:hypothetical protein
VASRRINLNCRELYAQVPGIAGDGARDVLRERAFGGGVGGGWVDEEGYVAGGVLILIFLGLGVGGGSQLDGENTHAAPLSHTNGVGSSVTESGVLPLQNETSFAKHPLIKSSVGALNVDGPLTRTALCTVYAAWIDGFMSDLM